VLLLVTAETAFPEQVAGERGRGLHGVLGGRHPRPRASRERVQRGEMGGGVERGIGDPRDGQRPAVELGPLARPDEGGEVVPQAAGHDGLATTRAGRSSRGGGAHAGPQSSTTFPSGSRTQSCEPPNSRYGMPRASRVFFTSASDATWTAKCGAVGSIPSNVCCACWMRCSCPPPRSYQAPGNPRSGRGAIEKPSTPS